MSERPERRSELVRPAGVVVAVVAGLVGVLVGVTFVLTPDASVPAGAPAAGRPAAAAAGAPPAQLWIPELRRTLDHIVDLGRVGGGRREQPGTAAGVGWFADGPAPGSPGVAVLSGHSGFGYTNGAFAGLATLMPGALLVVRDETGHDTRFTVRHTALFPPAEPDSTLVAPEGTGPELRLITSDGTFDRAGVASARVAVYAVPS
ncbi:class F sortase [Amycolatopsis sp. NBC_00438]|uniref:class F sortase n=1 Tax=Amycolatopsis sp. NBC_00438 TaxID=2903558 RepID=UPI002E23F12C